MRGDPETYYHWTLWGSGGGFGDDGQFPALSRWFPREVPLLRERVMSGPLFFWRSNGIEERWTLWGFLVRGGVYLAADADLTGI